MGRRLLHMWDRTVLFANGQGCDLRFDPSRVIYLGELQSSGDSINAQSK